MKSDSKPCLACLKPFEAKKPWATFCGSRCKDVYRRECEEIGRLFRSKGKDFSDVLENLEQVVAGLATKRPLLGDVVSECAAVHARLARLLEGLSVSSEYPSKGAVQRQEAATSKTCSGM